MSLSILSVYSEESGMRTGTSIGFYDSTNSGSEEDDINENIPQIRMNENSDTENVDSIHKFTDDDLGIVISSKTNTNATKNYSEIYNNLEVPDFSYLHNIDPDQYYDMKDTTWSVYPLFRLISPIYFKNITIEPGYYLLTPREHNGKWYILFKQNGIVMHIIPVYERDITPEMFYDEHIPKEKLTAAQKMHKGFLDLVGKTKSSKRKTPIKSYMEVNDLENYFVSIIIYYGNHKYSTIFRTIRL